MENFYIESFLRLSENECDRLARIFSLSGLRERIKLLKIFRFPTYSFSFLSLFSLGWWLGVFHSKLRIVKSIRGRGWGLFRDGARFAVPVSLWSSTRDSEAWIWPKKMDPMTSYWKILLWVDKRESKVYIITHVDTQSVENGISEMANLNCKKPSAGKRIISKSN